MARVLISMPEEFLSRIDQVAEGENRTRSELIREALRSYMYKSINSCKQKCSNFGSFVRLKLLRKKFYGMIFHLNQAEKGKWENIGKITAQHYEPFFIFLQTSLSQYR